MSDKSVHDQPSDAAAQHVSPGHSVVHIQGPADVAISMTPAAALETARRIGDAAVDALLEDAKSDEPEAGDSNKA